MVRHVVFAAAFSVALFTAHLVTADAPPGRYMIANGTVFDTKTKLTWQQEPPTNNNVTFAGAKMYCAGLSLGGVGAWRVPTIKELLTIVELKPPPQFVPSIDGSAFLNVVSGMYWSSTPTPQGLNQALGVDFSNGRLDNQGTNATNAVRCVR